MKQEMRMITMLDIFKINPHPDNPRLDVGDISELIESIKKNGIMQNLTVMPEECLKLPADEQPDIRKAALKKYVVLIGHRRLAAAKAAGLDKVPCKVVSGISKSDQISIMLEENMQRNNLTVYEQAQSFQLMLDLGETVESVSEKTGFSKTTIYHRINIAKLNQEELKKKEEDDNFQLNIQDLISLEKVKDLKKRNEILKNARDSKSLKYMANTAAVEEKREENYKKILEQLNKNYLIVKEADRIYSWEDKWKVIKEIDLDKDVPDKIKLKKVDGILYYSRSFSKIIIAEKTKKEEKQKGLSEEEKLKRKNKKVLNALKDDLSEKITTTIEQILLKNIEWVKAEELTEKMWGVFTLYSPSCRRAVVLCALNNLVYGEDKNYWNLTDEEKENLVEIINGYPVPYQMLLAMYDGCDFGEAHNYNNEFDNERAKKANAIVNILKMFGFSLTKEEERYLDGTHEAYKK
ncbi:MAG: ParB/RepB/Spo0J family partition protein [Lachnospiraceae bacterium]|nr:ParB/RepB/Spo0J family partition protein [Lachnospiraceae bacterium]